MDFYTIPTPEPNKKGIYEIRPSWEFGELTDLIIRGGAFYAVWDEANGVWTCSEQRAMDIIDEDLKNTAIAYEKEHKNVRVQYCHSADNHRWKEFKNNLKIAPPQPYILFDKEVTYHSDITAKEDYRLIRLPYDLNKSEPEAFNTLMDTLYNKEELEKIEWGVGSILCGEPAEKCFVLYGDAGTGKSTLLHIVERIFGGPNYDQGTYWVPVLTERFGDRSDRFAVSQLADNPMVGIQHDADLSFIERNTVLNSIISHEPIAMEVKHQAFMYNLVLRTVLFLGTNSPVKINDTKSGLVRRLVDVYPTGKQIPFDIYSSLLSRVNDFEIGMIANKCIEVYKRKGKNAYFGYVPSRMIRETNHIYDFLSTEIEDQRLADGGRIALRELYSDYNMYCDKYGQYKMSRIRFIQQVTPFFDEFSGRAKRRVSGYKNPTTSVFVGFHSKRLYDSVEKDKSGQLADGISDPDSMLLGPTDLNLVYCRSSSFDKMYGNAKAQAAGVNTDHPMVKWKDCKSRLRDVIPRELHYVQLPEKDHIVIDFDIPNADGEKDLEANLKAASAFPPTYAELSRSGKGVHLHYFYDGDVSELPPTMPNNPHIEIKVFTGDQSLRRKLTYANNEKIAHLTPGQLPLKGKEVKKSDMLSEFQIKNEKALRTLIKNNLAKKYHGYTKPSVQFIKTILDEAYDSGLEYDVSDLRGRVANFAARSTHHSQECLAMVSEMKFASEGAYEDETEILEDADSDALTFFDVEVFPNLFVIVWKTQGDDKFPHELINPSRELVQNLLKLKLVGFNNRKYDNHILYAWANEDYDNEQLYKLSKALVSNNADGQRYYRPFPQAYNLSYADIYDFSSKKQSLKKFEIELGINHLENEYPWDEPVPKEKWPQIVEYCTNDVLATEAVFNARHGDYLAREILSSLSGLPVNSTTRSHATKIIFGENKHPQDQFVYTDLSEIFPGYQFIPMHYEDVTDDSGKTKRVKIPAKSIYLDESVAGVKEGGYVYSEPGLYENVITLDVESMHPNSIIQLNLFGDKYTKRFKDLLDARLAIKHGNFEKVREMFDGQLVPYLEDESTANDLANALKIVINSVYGYTSATFPCEFKDPRNIDNIVAKRGALFMVNLRHEVQKRGFTVAHIKTDSIKIPNPTQEIIDFVYEYGAKYGYKFDVEAEYEKFCLVDKAVYIAKEKNGHWSPKGAMFLRPYVYKTLFSHEPLEFKDLCETRSVSKGAIYLDRNEGTPVDPVTHDYTFVGRIGVFCPVVPGGGGGLLVRNKMKGDEPVKDEEGNLVFDAVTDTKPYRWMEAEYVKQLDLEDQIDYEYFEEKKEEAIKKIKSVIEVTVEKSGEQLSDEEKEAEVNRRFNIFIEGESNA